MFGYARVSTSDQKDDQQIDSLAKAGVEDKNIIRDVGVSDTRQHRPGLDALLAQVRSGDTVKVWKLDRLGRSMAGMVITMAEYERGLISERTTAALVKARENGRVGGRAKVMDEKLARRVLALIDSGHSAPEVASILGKSRATGYRYVKEAEDMREHLS